MPIFCGTSCQCGHTTLTVLKIVKYSQVIDEASTSPIVQNFKSESQTKVVNTILFEECVARVRKQKEAK